MFVHTGDYIEHIRDDALRSTYYTFTPLPLVGGNFYTMDSTLAASLAKAHRALGFLEGIIALTSDSELLADFFLLRESCFSKMIDYPDFNMNPMLMKRGKGVIDSDIKNIASAYRYATERPTQKLSFSSIISHALLGDNIERKIAIRTKPLFLTQPTSNYRQYNPTAPRNVRSAMMDISKYIESSDADILIKAAMCHYQFEIIHPYECYNGIVGRILLYHMLSNAKMDGVCFLSLSASLYCHKAEYFDKLGATQKSGNYTAWIEFFVNIVREAAQSSAELIKYCDALFPQEEEAISARRQERVDYTLGVYRYFVRNIASSIRHASEQLQFSFVTVSRSVAILQDLGILTQITKGSRNRVFAHAGLMNRLISPE